MTVNLGLRDSELEELKLLLKTPHWIKVTIQILDMNHTVLSDVSHMMLSGQVNFDTSSDNVYRTLELELSDPESELGINPDSPENGALFMNRMIKVVYSVAPPAPTKWYDIPLFVGPVTSLSRDSLTAKIGAAGKDSLALSTLFETETFKRHQKLTDLIVKVLKHVLGETKYAVPDLPRRTDKQVRIGAGTAPLSMLRKWADAVGYFLFWDGRGIAQVRLLSSKTLHTYDSSNVTSDVTFSYDPSTVINAVRVIGGKPKGSKKKVSAKAVAPDGHPLHPRNLGRKIIVDGEERIIPRYYTLIIEDSSLKTRRACKIRARSALNKGLRESLNIEFSCLPNPLQEEGDEFRVKMDDVDMTARAVQWSIPLTHDGQMSMGVNKKVSFKTRTKGKVKGKRNSRSRRAPSRRGGRRG